MRSALPAGLLLLFSSCALSSSRLDLAVKEFKAHHAGQIETFSGPSRSLRYAWSGDVKRPPLIFVHGSPGDWEGWIEFLQDQNLQSRFHVIAVDRPGYGGSGKGQVERSLKVQAADILEVLKRNESGQPALVVGHSYGGAVIAQMAADFPAKIRGLIFVASSVDPALEVTKWYQVVAEWYPFRWLVPTDLRVCNEEILALKDQLEILKPRWAEIRASVATIQGTTDDLVPLANQDFILAHIPASQIIYKDRVPGMNHFVPWQHPELILSAIKSFDRP